MKKRDFILLLVGVAIVVFLYMAPPVSTPYVPQNEQHQDVYTVYAEQGKKAAGKICIDCHDIEAPEFLEKHKRVSRCLFCHRLER